MTHTALIIIVPTMSLEETSQISQNPIGPGTSLLKLNDALMELG